jgi:hypothetical protein
MVMFNTTSVLFPAFVTVAFVPGAVVVTLPIAMVGVDPFVHAGHVPVAPCGRVMFNTTSVLVPAFVTVAFVPGAVVVTLPMTTVLELPGGPDGPCGPGVLTKVPFSVMLMVT